MHANLTVPLSTLFGFLLVLARVSGVILFVPVPGMQSAPEIARIVLAVTLSFILMPKWPAIVIGPGFEGRMPGWILAEFTFGLLAGAALAFLLEGLQVAAQIIGLQAGYSFASTIDPTTQADSAILQIIAQLFAGILFFGLGLDRDVVRVLAASLDRVPAASALPVLPIADAVIHLGSQMFTAGLRLALPVLALLLMMDLAFAIVGKVHSQFQLISLSFSAKMLAGLSLLAITLAGFPKLVQIAAAHTFFVIGKLLGG